MDLPFSRSKVPLLFSLFPTTHVEYSVKHEHPNKKPFFRERRKTLMKNLILLFLLFSTTVAKGQIFTQNSVDGSITLTPKGVKGNTNSGTITNNVALGPNTLGSNTTGNFNTATGYSSLLNNTTGNRNTANGNEALLLNTIGIKNTATGQQALRNNTTGNRNTANGNEAL